MGRVSCRPLLLTNLQTQTLPPSSVLFSGFQHTATNTASRVGVLPELRAGVVLVDLHVEVKPRERHLGSLLATGLACLAVHITHHSNKEQRPPPVQQTDRQAGAHDTEPGQGAPSPHTLLFLPVLQARQQHPHRRPIIPPKGLSEYEQYRQAVFHRHPLQPARADLRGAHGLSALTTAAVRAERGEEDEHGGQRQGEEPAKTEE